MCILKSFTLLQENIFLLFITYGEKILLGIDDFLTPFAPYMTPEKDNEKKMQWTLDLEQNLSKRVPPYTSDRLFYNIRSTIYFYGWA